MKALGKQPPGICKDCRSISCIKAISNEDHYKTALLEAADELERFCDCRNLTSTCKECIIANWLRISAGDDE